MRTRAKPNADKMVARKIDDKYPLGIGANRANSRRVGDVYDKSETFKGRIFKKVTIPHLDVGLARVSTLWDA